MEHRELWFTTTLASARCTRWRRPVCLRTVRVEAFPCEQVRRYRSVDWFVSRFVFKTFNARSSSVIAVRVAIICPRFSPPPVGAQAPRAPPSRRNVAVLSHAEYVHTLTAAAALRVKAAFRFYSVTCIRAALYKKLNFAILYTTFVIHVRLSTWLHLLQRGYVFIGVCLFVCLFICLFVNRITQKLFNRLSQNSGKGGTNTTEEPIRFWRLSGSHYSRVGV